MADQVASTTPFDATGDPQRDAGRVGAGAWVIAAVFVLLLGTRQSQVVPLSLGQAPAPLVVVVAVLLLLLCWLAGQQIRAPHRPTMLLVMVALLSTLASSAALSLRGGAAAGSADSVVVLVREAQLVGLVLLVLVVVHTRAGLETVIRGVVIGATLSGVVGLLSTFGGIDLSSVIALPGLTDQGGLLSGTALERAGVVRAQGMAGHPLELSAVLTAALPLSAALLMADRERGRTGVPWAATSALLLVAALSTVSRSAVIGVVAAVLVMATAWPVRRVVTLLGAGLAAVLLALATGLPIVTRVASVILGGSQDSSLQSRQNGFAYALQVLPDHWWLGQGAGSYDPATQPVLDNAYLTRMVETGGLGLIAVIAMLGGAVLIVAGARRRFIAHDDAVAAELSNGVLGSLVAVVVISLILDVPGFAQIMSLEYLVIALAGVCAVLARRPVTSVRVRADQPTVDA